MTLTTSTFRLLRVGSAKALTRSISDGTLKEGQTSQAYYF